MSFTRPTFQGSPPIFTRPRLRNILIIRLSSLGDILHALPAYQSLRDAYPEARIDWLVERRMAFLVSAIQGLDGIIEIDTPQLRKKPAAPEGWQAFLEAIRRLRRAGYDVSLDFQGLLKTAFLGLASGARTRLGFSHALVRERPAHWFYHRTLAGPGKPLHVVALNQLLAAEAGAPATTRPVQLSTSSADEAAVAERVSAAGVREFAVLNPGGGWPTKRWSPSRYGALASKIAGELGLPVVVTTGPGEAPLFDQIAACCPGPPPHHFQLPFLQLIPLFRRTRLFVGGDTGPFHLACALGTPTVGILGPTDPARNGPWSDADESVVRVLPCSFCNGRTCPTRNECMDIGVEQVFQAIAQRLRRQH